jgi:hypothetical protein
MDRESPLETRDGRWLALGRNRRAPADSSANTVRRKAATRRIAYGVA